MFILLFDVETVPELANPAILECLELQINLAPSEPRWGRYMNFSQKNFRVFYKNQNAIYNIIRKQVNWLAYICLALNVLKEEK